MDNEDGIVEDFLDQMEKQGPIREEPKGFLESLTDYTSWILRLAESNGWFILFACIVIYYFYQKYKSNLTRMLDRSQHKKIDEEAELKRLRNIEAVRQRQQAALDAAAAKYLEEKRIKEEQLAKQRAEEWERHQQGLGYKSKIKKTNNEEEELAAMGLAKRTPGQQKPRLRGADYNPLTGQSNSSSSDGPSCFRPSSRRDAGGRGG